ncbi:hypothetical protein CLV98_1632 [Dyadobacter jejuensis]|uniref:Uncharacterized protein n=1 Tax=Dyadobacter jejuensis TaxID=1082580 RepID=A0A315ZRR5_9BACT|nr:hypothetical protein [Dyadobacter jejuensis]PWJ47568.1 hypothetical protein CLV98_1632 [Dyadobacter jejuensis]
MDTIRYRNKTYKGPAGWKDCHQLQYEKLIPFCRLPADAITDEIYGMAARLIFRIRPLDWARWRLSQLQWDALKKQIQWVFAMPEGKPFEYFEHDGIRYLLMDELFADTSALELSMAMMAYTDFVRPDDRDLSALDRLLATIYRPERKDLKAFKNSEEWNGDMREPYNESRMLMHAQHLATLSLETKTILLTYFEVQTRLFLDQYDELFGGDTEPRYSDGRGWIMMLKNIAKEGHFGNFDQVCRQPVHLVFVAALDDTLNAEEIREKQENGYEY